jgi:hypothetical protein
VGGEIKKGAIVTAARVGDDGKRVRPPHSLPEWPITLAI